MSDLFCFGLPGYGCWRGGGELHDDPVVFAIKDRMSQALGVLAAAILIVGIALLCSNIAIPPPAMLSGWSNFPPKACFDSPGRRIKQSLARDLSPPRPGSQAISGARTGPFVRRLASDETKCRRDCANVHESLSRV